MATKKHNIDILVAADNVNILNAMPIPTSDDPRLWNVEYTSQIEPYKEGFYPTEFAGASILRAHICFEDVTERENAVVALRAAQGLFHQCNKESYIEITTNDHPLTHKERTGDKIEYRYGRDSSGNGADSMGIYTEAFDDDGISLGRNY